MSELTLVGRVLKAQKGTYILVSFEAAPPAIFCTRSWPSSDFRSSSCFFRSSLLFPQRAPVLIFALEDCVRVSEISV